MKASKSSVAAAIVWLLWPLLAGPAPTLPAVPLRPADIVAHLARTIAWHRHMVAVEQSAQLSSDVLARDSARRTSTRALQFAFDFARAGAPLVSTGQPTGGKGVSSTFNVEQASTRALERVTGIERQIAEIDAATGRPAGKKREALIARRHELQAELILAKQVRDSVQGLRSFLIGQEKGNGPDLPGYIDRLERSVPEAIRGSQPAAPVTAPAAAAPLFRPESAGILGLAAETLRMARTKSQLGDALDETDTLRKNAGQLQAMLVAVLKNVVRRGDELTADSGSQDAKQIDSDRQEIEALTGRFKQVSSALAPLREHVQQIEIARGNLVECRNSVQQRYSTAASYLMLRVLAVVLTIALVLGVSELWRRGTFRYVRDARRRKQFLLLRRVVVSCVIAGMVMMGLASEVGSLATYAGFLTAGLAVALQNVILSVIAYFFLIGRYGLRVGDRVTISGVTGDVVEIGLVRIYLMEMSGTGMDLHPTGRVVGFSNSVVFQPAALFRQMPGTDYTWRTVTLTLTQDTDLAVAESRLMAAARAVYETYRERIENQHAAFQRLVDVAVPPPRPEGRLRFTNGGLEFQLRYPAELHRASATDDQMINALHDAIEQEPRLALAGSGAPKLQATA